MTSILLFLLIPLCLVLVNASNFAFLRKAIRQHDLYVDGLGTGVSKEKKESSKDASIWITANITEIKKKVKNAGVANPVLTQMVPAGYSHLQQQSFSVLDNLLFQNVSVMQQGRHVIEVAKGYYLSGIKRAVNPIYWIELLIFLPKSIFNATGLEATSKFAEAALKLVQILYWLAMIWLALFRPEIFVALADAINT